MRKLFLTIVATLMIATPALADYTFVVPQKPGAGTSQWAQIVAGELEKKLGEKIRIKHIPGARDIPGFNKFHNGLMMDDKTIMVSHGGNGVAFLQANVDYNYADYDSIGLMNLNIIVGKQIGLREGNIKFAAGSGMVPEGLALTLLACGNGLSLEQYSACFRKHVTWVPGMSGGQRRLAYKRGELNVTRENPAAYKKHVIPNKNSETWFHHGILQADGSHADDPNYPGKQLEILFKQKWGEAPTGNLYDAYKLVKSFRDGLQKALWVRKGNPNTEKLRYALHAMTMNPESQVVFQKKVGKYDWIVGQSGNEHRDVLMSFINEKALKTLVVFNKRAFGLKSVYKPTLLK